MTRTDERDRRSIEPRSRLAIGSDLLETPGHPGESLACGVGSRQEPGVVAQGNHVERRTSQCLTQDKARPVGNLVVEASEEEERVLRGNESRELEGLCEEFPSEFRGDSFWIQAIEPLSALEVAEDHSLL